jgi:hypothetical protein
MGYASPKAWDRAFNGLQVTGRSEFFEPVRNLLHRQPRAFAGKLQSLALTSSDHEL